MANVAGKSGERAQDMRGSTQSKPLSGVYKDQKFVEVYGEKAQEELRLLGSYGSEYQRLSKKDPNRMGLLDKQIVDTAITNEKNTTVLTLHEAFFLCHALGCIAIHSPHSDEPLSVKGCWDLFRGYHKKVKAIDFAISYAAYYFYRSRGWIVKDGINFGVDFLLYSSGPFIEHAQYALHIICDYGIRSASNNWVTLMTLHRVVQSVGKELLLSYVTVPDLTESLLDNPMCVQSMSIGTRSFKANASVPARSSPPLVPSIKHTI